MNKLQVHSHILLLMMTTGVLFHVPLSELTARRIAIQHVANPGEEASGADCMSRTGTDQMSLDTIQNQDHSAAACNTDFTPGKKGLRQTFCDCLAVAGKCNLSPNSVLIPIFL